MVQEGWGIIIIIFIFFKGEGGFADKLCSFFFKQSSQKAAKKSKKSAKEQPLRIKAREPNWSKKYSQNCYRGRLGASRVNIDFERGFS